jgi:acyl carrier protein
MNGSMEDEVKLLIIESLCLEDMRPEDIINDSPLFGEGLGLDSIDALELGMAIHNKYGISIEAGDKNVRHHFSSVATLAAFIASNKK